MGELAEDEEGQRRACKEAGFCPMGDGATGWGGEAFSDFHLREITGWRCELGFERSERKK